MFYLIHYDPPFWNILEESHSPKRLDDLIPEYGCIPCGDMIITDDKGLESIKTKYPQVRTMEDE